MTKRYGEDSPLMLMIPVHRRSANYLLAEREMERLRGAKSRFLRTPPLVGACPGVSRRLASRLAVDAATFETQKAKCHGASRQHTPLNRVHRVEIAGQFAPRVEKPAGKRKSGKDGCLHDEPSFLSWCPSIDAKPHLVATTCSAKLGHSVHHAASCSMQNRLLIPESRSRGRFNRHI